MTCMALFVCMGQPAKSLTLTPRGGPWPNPHCSINTYPPPRNSGTSSNFAKVLVSKYGIEMTMHVERSTNPKVEKLLLDGRRAGLNPPDKERKAPKKLYKGLP